MKKLNEIDDELLARAINKPVMVNLDDMSIHHERIIDIETIDDEKLERALSNPEFLKLR